ncbi:chaperone protein HtpG [Spirochaetia bacterium]|nr:chaperone protein HtpG [Spirochaetia bacterium]GHU33978.1 chaperone protein HtpG [Spirochaetia bacterium]
MVHHFQTEVSTLLHLIIHSLYSNREIFLRELISNASDALDKLKYLTVADDSYKSLNFDPRIDISFDKDARILVVTDNGIGMNETDLEESLGTIARSGTKAFLEKLNEDAKRDSNLIGQFGVGFYSAFMVAHSIEVTSRKAGEEQAWKWASDGKENYTIESAQRETQGTTVLLYLTEEGTEYANRWSIEGIIKRYSNHVAFPIYLTFDDKKYGEKGEEISSEKKTERINSGTALWRRPKSELKDEDYKEFYRQLGHDSEDPFLYLHTKAEGTLEYTTLFYIPAKAPFDMFHADYKPGVKLYVRRVFITDDDKELMPTYLRFVRGVIDSEDLPLNVSREILQQNKILFNIKTASVKKLLGEFKSLSENDKEKYMAFIEQFNRPLKEGLYQDFANRELLEELVRFKSTTVEGFTSFSEYASRMKTGQKYIYFITGSDAKTLKSSPLLEAYKAKDLEVLIMDDEIDEIIVPSLGMYKEWELRAVNRTGADEELGEKPDTQTESESQPVIEKIKKALENRVKDVRLSRRLHDSPSCIVADENDPTLQLAHLLKAMGQAETPDIKPILEINGEHPIVLSIKNTENEAKIADVAGVLLDQALLMEGIRLQDPADFVQRMNRLLTGYSV